MSLYNFTKFLLRPATKLAFAARSGGAENVPPAGPLVVASNHVSYLDPPLLGTWFPRTIHFMAKQELFQIPVFGGILKRVHAFPVDRNRGDVGAIRRALHILKAGGVVGIFPEGRRNIDGEAQARNGAVLLAATAHCPLVPVALIRTNIAAKRLRASRVEVRIGKPIVFQGRERKPAKAELSGWTDLVAERIAALMQEPVAGDSQVAQMERSNLFDR